MFQFLKMTNVVKFALIISSDSSPCSLFIIQLMMMGNLATQVLSLIIMWVLLSADSVNREGLRRDKARLIHVCLSCGVFHQILSDYGCLQPLLYMVRNLICDYGKRVWCQTVHIPMISAQVLMMVIMLQQSSIKAKRLAYT